jgi:anti-sigma factor RsiW
MTHLGEVLSAYLDGEVSGSEKEQVAEHLVICDSCRAELSDLHAARSVLRALPLLDAPEWLDPEAPLAPVIPLRKRPRVWIAAAAAAVAAFVGVATIAAPESTVPISVEQITVEYGNRAVLDPGLTPGKLVPPAPPIGGAE